MKHHETRRLIDDLVTTANTYAHTGQLRAQLALTLKKHLPEDYFPSGGVKHNTGAK